MSHRSKYLHVPYEFIIQLKVRNIILFQDPIACLTKASAQWEKRIHKSLNSMCSDLETSLAKMRPQSEKEELAEKWNELSTYNLGKFLDFVGCDIGTYLYLRIILETR